MLGDGEELSFEDTPETWNVVKRGPDGATRELHLAWDEEDQRLMVTVYTDTEHCLIVLDRSQAKAVTHWLTRQIL